jgi:GNAT superfamily N-acetyltransferase
MRVEQIDTDDDVALGYLLAIHNASAHHDLPVEPDLSLSEMRQIAKGFGEADTEAILVRNDDGAVVGAGVVRMPTKDNLEIAEFLVEVHPYHRRQGVGTAIVEHLERVAIGNHRKSFSSQSGNMLGASPPSEPFAAKLGYVAVLAESQWTLRLPVAAKMLDDLEQASISHAGGYDIVCWQDRCPDELVDGQADLLRGMSTDAPHGDLAHEAQIWDGERVRSLEDTVLKMGNKSYLAGAVEKATGRLVSYTVIGVNKSTTESARQFATIVNRHHRGHRLGVLVKIANLRQLMEHSPATATIQTWNADTNTHMMRVNALLGFEASGHSTAWQKELAAGTPA